MRNTTIWLAVFILIGVIIVGYFVTPRLTTNTPAQVSFAGHKQIAVMDRSFTAVTQNTLFQGEDVVLAISPNWYGETTTNFSDYDVDHSGYLMASDPVFSYLELLIYKDGKEYLNIPLSSAGVRAISVVEDQQTKMYKMVFSDGSYRWLRIIK